MTENIEQVVAKTIEVLEAREAARKAEDAKVEAAVEARMKAERAEWEKDRAALEEAKEAKGPVYMKEAVPGFGEKEQKHAFLTWMRTGDGGAAKSLVSAGSLKAELSPAILEALNATEEGRKAVSLGGTAAYLVPDEFVNTITEKRDKLSFVRQAGFRILQTSRDAIDVPAEGTSLTKFTRTAEAAAYSTNDPTFNQNKVTPQKWTKETRFSEEILEDDATNLEDFYTDALARAMAQTEAYYVAIGSGTNQHEGVMIGGTTDGLVFDSATNITPDEIYELANKLNTGYRDTAMWLMNSDTWRYLITLRDTSNWAFGVADMATLNTGATPQVGTLYGKPVFVQDDIATRATKAQVIGYGNPYFYGLVERRGLTIARNPYLYQATGLVAFFSSFRQSGKVLIKEAWQLAYMA